MMTNQIFEYLKYNFSVQLLKVKVVYVFHPKIFYGF